jgi:hypothetical protein
MKAASIGHSMTYELFVIQVDGHAKSAYRRSTDALKAALRLKDQFPGHTVKVRAMPERWSRLFEQIFRLDKWSICQG